MKSVPLDSSRTHVLGESEYVDDRTFLANELQVGVLYSDHPRARIKAIDLKQALHVPGIVAAFTAKDFKHLNWGTIFQDQPLLAQDEVFFVGEPIALLAAETAQALREAKRVVKISYEDLPAILDLETAIIEKSFIAGERKIERGDVEGAFKNAPHTLEGSITLQGADHFYLESQATIAYPLDDGGLEIHSSSQHPTEVQHVVAHGLGLDYKDVTCIVKRMGGGFGGKESQAAPFAAFAGLVAHRLKRPARVVLTKDDDMIMTGKRNPFQNFYKVGFDHSGMILALDAKLYSDGGAYADLSTAIMERAMLHSDNAYFIPHVRITGQVCKTHYHPHTAFRGFGGPKGVAMIEKIIEQIAQRLKIDALTVRKRNCYRPEHDVTPYGQKLENNVLPELFEKLEKSCDYHQRRKEIIKWNQSHHSTLRGLSLTAVKFGISFTTRFLNQGNALVILSRDGSVQISTGATEMGQGVNTRIAQLVSEELGLSLEKTKVLPTSTDRNANTSPTAASSGTDLNGSAAVLAARKIKARLSELAKILFELPEEKWASKTAGLGSQPEIQVSDLENANSQPSSLKFQNDHVIHSPSQRKISLARLANEAYLNRISLSEYAHYSVPNLGFNKLTGQGRAFLYYTNGVGATEVSVDRLSGEVKVLRTDLLMDLGRPINEALDLGQVTGAYIQGLGWMTTENLFYKGGKLLSHSPSTYKIPNIQDTPRVFNVDLIENHGNTSNIRQTKAVGEPPLMLAISAWTAIGDAIAFERGSFPDLKVPATSETVLRALKPELFAHYERF